MHFSMFEGFNLSDSNAFCFSFNLIKVRMTLLSFFGFIALCCKYIEMKWSLWLPEVPRSGPAWEEFLMMILLFNSPVKPHRRSTSSPRWETQHELGRKPDLEEGWTLPWTPLYVWRMRTAQSVLWYVSGLDKFELRTKCPASATSATRDASKPVAEFLPQMDSPQPLSSLQLFFLDLSSLVRAFAAGNVLTV